MDKKPTVREMEDILKNNPAPEPKTPRKSAPKKTEDKPPSMDDVPEIKLTPKLKILHTGIVEVYTAAQMACYMWDPFVSELIGNSKVQCADAWIDLARKDAKVLRLLERMTTGSAYGALLMAHIPIVIPVLAKHGIVPGGALFTGGVMNSMTGVQTKQPPAPRTDESVERGFVTADVSSNGNSPH